MNQGGREHQRKRRSPSPFQFTFLIWILSDATRSEEGQDTRRPCRRRHMRPQRAWHRAQKFKEGGKNVTFLTYDGAYGQTDKLLSFIKQFDAALWWRRLYGVLKAPSCRNVSLEVCSQVVGKPQDKGYSTSFLEVLSDQDDEAISH